MKINFDLYTKYVRWKDEIDPSEGFDYIERFLIFNHNYKFRVENSQDLIFKDSINVLSWCEENLTGSWSFITFRYKNHFYFTNKEDALKFILRYTGDNVVEI